MPRVVAHVWRSSSRQLPPGSGLAHWCDVGPCGSMTRTRGGKSRFGHRGPGTAAEVYSSRSPDSRVRRAPGSVDPHEHCHQRRSAGRRRADLGGPRWGPRRLRHPLRAARRRGPPPGPPARPGRRRRGPRLRGLRQGARRAAARRRSRRRLPRLPAHLRAPPPGRPVPCRREAAHHRRHGGLRPGGAVPRHRRRGLRERCGRPRLRLAARAVAAGRCGTPRSRATSPPTSRRCSG